MALIYAFTADIQVLTESFIFCEFKWFDIKGKEYLKPLDKYYIVAIGKLDNKEVDFIATKTDEKKCIQVTESMNAPETRERALSPCGSSRTTTKKSSSQWNATCQLSHFGIIGLPVIGPDA